MSGFEHPFPLLPTYVPLLFSGMMVSVSLVAYGLKEGSKRHVVGAVSNKLFIINSFALATIFLRIITESPAFKTVGIIFVGLTILYLVIASFQIINQGRSELLYDKFLKGEKS